MSNHAAQKVIHNCYDKKVNNVLRNQ